MFYKMNSDGFSNVGAVAADLVNTLMENGFVAKYLAITNPTEPQEIVVPKVIATATLGDPSVNTRSVSVVGHGSNYTAATAKTRGESLLTIDTIVQTETIVLPASAGTVDATLECPTSLAINGKKWRIKITAIGASTSLTYPAPLTDAEQEQLTTVTRRAHVVAPPYYSPTLPNYRTDTQFGISLATNEYRPNAILWDVTHQTGWKKFNTYTYSTAPTSMSIFVGTELNLLNGEKDENDEYILGSGKILYDSVPATTTALYNDPTLVHPLGGLSAVNWGNFAFRTTNVTLPDGTQRTKSGLETENPPNIGKYFYSNYFLGVNSLSAARVFNYSCISITDRGIFFGVWNTDTQDTGKYFSWFLIEYPVMKDTGDVRGRTTVTADSLTPLFCLFSSPADNTYVPAYGKVIVRERDIGIPSKIYRPVTVRDSSGVVVSMADAEDQPVFINPHKQVCFDENGNYIATFLSDLTTRRYFYPDELDMVATVSADLVGYGQELQFTVYGESQPRTYIALHANGPNNTGMRILVLKNDPNSV